MNKLDKYKIVFIKENGIEYYGDNLPNTYHCIYLKEYIDKYYKEHSFLSKLTASSGIDALAYSLVYFTKTAIVLNVTNDVGKNYVIVELPTKISNELGDTLMSFSSQLENYSDVLFEEVVVEDYGNKKILNSHPLKVEADLSIKDKFKYIISMHEEKGKKF